MTIRHEPSPAATVVAPTAAERRLSALLRALAGVLFVAAVVYAIGPFVGDFFREPPFVANSVVKVSLLGLACLYAAGDVRRRRGLVGIVIGAHAVSVAAMASMLAFAGTGERMNLGFSHPTIAAVLWNAIALDGAITALLVVFFVLARGPAAPRPDEGGAPGLLLPLAALLAAGAVGYEVAPFIDTTKGFARELPFVTNSVVKTAALAALCVYAARRELALAGPIAAVHALSVLVSAVYLIFLDTGYSLPLLGGSVSMTTALWVALALDGAIAVAVTLASLASWRRRYGLTFLAPVEYRALIACADVLVAGPAESIPPEQVAANVEAYVSKIRAHRRWVYRLVLFGIELTPLLTLRPPLSMLAPGARRAFLVEHFERPPKWPPFLKHAVMIMIRVCQQLSFAGYYSDPRAWPSIGYTPFSARVREDPPPEPGPHPLLVQRPEDIGVKSLEADVCIVGSGAGGGILAYELARRGRSVLILERGQYVEPRDFTEDEVGMIGRLYADGVMQQTEDWRFTVLQGSCVGGSTTVNNAVCFRPPEAVVAGWDGVDAEALYASVDHVEDFLRVARQPAAPLNPSGVRYVEGARALGVSPGRLEVDAVRANIDGCIGCGYCNIGCKWGHKLSMLETALPWAQRDFPGRVKIIADCEVERLVTLSGSPRKVTALRARLADGRGLTVRAQTYVLSAGAVGSSYVLLQSGVRGVPVGKGFSCNMGAPLTAEFDGPALNAFAGLQISHYGVPRERGFVFETWFNPPVSQALNMPGWFERHYENMRRYDHLMAVGVLVGTASNGVVGKALTGGAGITFVPQAGDLATMARGLKLLGEILFEAGASRVMLNTWGYDEFTSPDQLGALDRIVADPDYVTLGTGHPQGGNPIGLDPKRSVVGPDFRVHGYSNLHVCDASVFPSSLTVNPQLTVMGLAHYAASRIA
jgi:choline dehydrogenase-like flavoprotein